MSAERPVDVLLRTVVEAGLCTRCGTCAGACPERVISFPDPIGECLPAAGEGCASCGLCLAACPGPELAFAPLERELFGETPTRELVGVVRGAWIAHATDPGIRRRGASGGVVTALLLDSLRRGETRGAALFAPHASEPWRGWGRIARTQDEIRASAESRYHLSPLNAVLGDVARSDGPLAYVGLPCQIHGLRRLERAGWVGRSRLGPVIGLYCGNNLYFKGTAAVMRKLGMKRIDDVEKLAYREGTWPGSFSVKTRDGRVRSVQKLHFNQAIPFYVNRRCLFCVDLAAELADISVGDGWMREKRDEEGWSVVLVRSERGEGAFREALASGAVAAREISLEEVFRMHAHAFDLKKRGAFIRLGLWRRFGCAVPRYDRPVPRASFARRLAEVVVSAQFALASSRPGRILFAAMPLGATGGIFARARTVWMRSASRWTRGA